jgi:DNA polymerase-4
VKYADFTLITRRVTLERPTDDDRAILAAARGLLARVEVDRPVRLTGISVSGFAEEAERGQLDLFGAGGAPAAAGADAEVREAGRRKALNAALDALAERFGKGAVEPADLKERPPRRRS